MPDAVHRSPHDLHGESLEELVANGNRDRQSSLWTKLVSLSPIAWQRTSTECSECHREHQGSQQDLKEMTTERCQACHRDQFQSFSHGHPEFKEYPAHKPKNIAFDHLKHRDLHFAKKSATFDCKTCHIESDQIGVVGQVFRSVSFERACASCHVEPIKSAVQDGVVVLQIPSINRRELLSHGSDIGNWPTQASQLTDGTIPPIMKLLIQSEPDGAALLEKLPASGRLVEMDLSNPDSRAALLNLSAVTKQLMQKLANEGQPGFRNSVEKLISTSASASSVEANSSRGPWLDSFANGIPPDLFRAAWREWFEPGISSATLGQSATGKPPSVRLSSSIRSTDDDLLLGSGSLLNPVDGDLLSGTPSEPPTESKEGSSVDAQTFKDSRAWDQLAFGGWMIDRQRMAIVYVPKGHADEWLSRCIELEEMTSGNRMRSSNADSQNRLAVTQQCRQCHSLDFNLQALVTPNGDSAAKENWNVAFRKANHVPHGDTMISSHEQGKDCWRAKRRAGNLQQITKFDHTPHLALPKIRDCTSCHRLVELNDNTEFNLASNLTHAPREEFAPIRKDLCSSCHQANAAGESCTQCHNYHVGIKGWLEGRP